MRQHARRFPLLVGGTPLESPLRHIRTHDQAVSVKQLLNLNIVVASIDEVLNLIGRIYDVERIRHRIRVRGRVRAQTMSPYRRESLSSLRYSEPVEAQSDR